MNIRKTIHGLTSTAIVLAIAVLIGVSLLAWAAANVVGLSANTGGPSWGGVTADVGSGLFIASGLGPAVLLDLKRRQAHRSVRKERHV